MTTQRISNAKVQIAADGPYLVSGSLPMKQQSIGSNATGESVKWMDGRSYPLQESFALCRCGQSAKKPFCDGTHLKAKFDGTETASRESHHSQAEVQQGPAMSLSDAKQLCAGARFCDPNGTVWNQVNDAVTREARTRFAVQIGDCPSGRLVAWDNAGKSIEPEFQPSIGLIEDPVNECAGPMWLKGGVQLVGSDGFNYEVRNRVTLCRCGASNNKPFCDGTHVSIKFKDD